MPTLETLGLQNPMAESIESRGSGTNTSSLTERRSPGTCGRTAAGRACTAEKTLERDTFSSDETPEECFSFHSESVPVELRDYQP